MPNHKSVQVTKLDATPPLRLTPAESHGRKRVATFDFTVPVGDAAIADTIELCDLPAGAVILGGKIAFEAMTTGGAAASIQIGITGTAAKYLGTTSVDAAGVSPFADTVALNYQEKLATKTRLIATVITEAWAAGQRLLGEVEYVAD